MGPPLADFPSSSSMNENQTYSKMNGINSHVITEKNHELTRNSNTSALHVALYSSHSNEPSQYNTLVPPPHIVNGHEYPSTSYDRSHGYAGFVDRPQKNSVEKCQYGRQLPKEEPLTRYDLERMLYNLRIQRQQHALNPVKERPICRADKCLPPPVPTEHREQAIVQLLEKISREDDAMRKLYQDKRKYQYSIGNFLTNLREKVQSSSMRHVGQYHIDRKGLREEPRAARSLDTPSSSKWLVNIDGYQTQGTTYNKPSQRRANFKRRAPDGREAEEEDDLEIRHDLDLEEIAAAKRRKGDQTYSGVDVPLEHQKDLAIYEIPPAPDRPASERQVRKLIRSKMHRCKRCKNRFVEKFLLIKHMELRHYDDYVIYMAQQEEEMEQIRREEIEAMKIEEITSGGFIPPASDIDATTYDVMPEEIPLPGEQYGGKVPTFDEYGGLRLPIRPFRKKVSPQCPFCDKRFRNEESLKKHIHKKHPECVNFVQCNICYKCLASGDELPTHICETKYICLECEPIRNLCGEYRLNAHRLKFHRGSNSGFRCTDCSRKFLTPRKLRKHRKMYHVVNKPYKCHWCDEFFPTETQVALHERIHTGIIKFECPLCDYRCNRYVKMGVHLKHEHGFVCSICQVKCADHEDLLSHVHSTHTGYVAAVKQHQYVESPRVWLMFKGE